MCKTFQLASWFTRSRSAAFTALLGLALSHLSSAQTPASDPPLPHRIHLILKDGSYQIVTTYRVKGPNVIYLSAERGGAEEIIPLSLVDLDATHAWEQRHIPGAHPDPPAPTGKSSIDPELLKEEADRAAFTLEVAPDLRLPEQDSVLALDFFQSTPELVPLAQSAGELNRNTAHNILKSAINPHASAHGIVELKGFRSAVQLHIPDPVLYIRVGEDPPTGGGTFTVDIQGASGNAPAASPGGSRSSRYVIVRADVRTDSRILASFNIPQLGTARRQEDVVETSLDPLPGGHWLKLTPREPLIFGEYALMEVLNDRDVNLGVWDFGIHPVAPENRDAIKPEPKRPFRLDHRRPE